MKSRQEAFIAECFNTKLINSLNKTATYLKYLEEEHKNEPSEDTLSRFLTKPELKNIFKNDRRLASVYELLQFSTSVNIIKPKACSETTLLHQQKTFALKMLLRTLSLPIGMACFQFSCGNSFLPEKIGIPPICTAIKLPPSYTTSIEPDIDEIEPEAFLFPSFNSSIGYALSFPSSCAPIQASWILYNRPNELTADYGAILYGFSLVGNDSFINFNFANDILQVGNPLLSAGMLLAIGVKYRQTCDVEAAMAISNYIPSFCPNGPAETEGTLVVQIAALIAAGLIYMGSRKKPIVVYLMQELCREGVVFMNAKSKIYKNIIEKELYNECYRNCAGIAIGLVCSGDGLQAESKLFALKNSGVLDQLNYASENSLYSTSATLAMTLIWMDSNDANILSIASKNHKKLLLKGNPHHFFLYTLFYRLISNKIDKTPADEFQSLCNESTGNFVNSLMDISACCLSIALKSVGTNDEIAMKFFVDFLSYLTNMEDGILAENTSFKAKLTCNSISLCINCMYSSIGLLAAGTGDIDVLKLLRKEHFIFHSFSRHAAIHFALGLVFLGASRFVLDTKNAFKKAFVVLSILPFFPESFNENSFFFQPIRFLWSLAAVARTNHNDSLSAHTAPFLADLKNHDCFTFLQQLLPESSDFELSLLKSEFFNVFECGMMPSDQLFTLLDKFFIHTV